MTTKTMTVVAEGGRVSWPNDGPMDLDSFRAWAAGEALPEKFCGTARRAIPMSVALAAG